jgi:hypothetical protein
MSGLQLQIFVKARIVIRKKDAFHSTSYSHANVKLLTICPRRLPRPLEDSEDEYRLRRESFAGSSVHRRKLGRPILQTQL